MKISALVTKLKFLHLHDSDFTGTQQIPMLLQVHFPPFICPHENGQNMRERMVCSNTSLVSLLTHVNGPMFTYESEQ